MRYLISLIVLVCCFNAQAETKDTKPLVGICQVDVPGWDVTKRIKGGQFVIVDSGDPIEFKELVRVGVTYWNLHIGRNLLIYEPLLPFSSPQPAWIIVKIVDTHTTSTKWDLNTLGRATVFKDIAKSCISGAILDIDPNVYYSLYKRHEADNRLLRRIIHEMGHAIGVPHSWQEGTVMYPKSGVELKLGDDSKDALKKLYGDKG